MESFDGISEAKRGSQTMKATFQNVIELSGRKDVEIGTFRGGTVWSHRTVFRAWGFTLCNTNNNNAILTPQAFPRDKQGGTESIDQNNVADLRHGAEFVQAKEWEKLKRAHAECSG